MTPSSPFGATMHAAVFRGEAIAAIDADVLALTTKQAPTCTQPTDVVIKVEAAGICQTDIHLIKGHDVAGVYPFPGMILGHENAGKVVSIGSGVSTVQVGDYVLCYPFVPSDEASAATSQPPSGGEDRRTPGISHDGGFAEYMLTDERCLVPVPDEASCRSLVALTDAGLAAFNGVQSVVEKVQADAPVVVVGIGGLGHLGIQFARAMGLSQIFIVEPRRQPRAWAQEIGLTRSYASVDDAAEAIAQEGVSIAAVIDFVGSSITAKFAMDVLAFGGMYSVIGVGGELLVPTSVLVERALTVQGHFVGSMEQLEACVALCLKHDIRPIVREYPLHDINQALVDLDTGQFLGRAVVHP
jgi:D-arabinose 1-dehydrogenase-like Zn-dependent alcohol dehydrogenase